jgi:DNA polymerase elongation subunit (family B)
MDIHIFDAIARDQHIIKQTADEVVVQYGSENDSDDYHDAGSSQGPREYVIQLFGTTAKGEQVSIEVEGFRPYLYLAVPKECKTPSEEFRWKTLIEEKIRGSFGQNSKLITFEQVLKEKLYGYTGGKTFRFIRISVPSMSMFYSLRKTVLTDSQGPKLRINGRTIEVFEANIDPMLRFFHMRNLQPCGWIHLEDDTFNVISEEDMIEGRRIKLNCTWTSVFPCAQPPCPVAPFRTITWDIECDSSDGSFPLAKQNYRRVAKQLLGTDPAVIETTLLNGFKGIGPLIIPPLKKPGTVPLLSKNLISSLKELLSENDTFTPKDREERINDITKLLDVSLSKSAPVAGDPIIQIGAVTTINGVKEKHIFVLKGCDPIDGIIVHSEPTESRLLLSWFTWVVENEFDVFVGYNTNSFDERYVWERLVELGLEDDENVQRMSRIFDTGGQMKLEEKRLASSALGDNFLYLWTTPGRLRVDLLGHIRRKAQLPSYKLDSVCGVYLSGKLSGVEAVDGKPDHWKLKTKQTGDARIGRAVQLLDQLGEDLTDKMEIVEINKGAYVIVTSEEDLSLIASAAYNWAIVKDDISPADIFRLNRGSNADRAKVAAYCVQDCDLTHELYLKLEVFNEVMSMANVCSVPVSYILTRGQGIKIESLIFKDCMELNKLIEVLPGGSDQTDSYEGAFVLTPDPGFYIDPVGVCDFASLYPSTMISENISHDMLVWVKEYNMENELISISYGSIDDEKHAPPGTEWTDIEFDILRPAPGDTRKQPEKKKMGTRVCRFAQLPNDQKGAIPLIVAKLLAARKAKRKEITTTNDPFKKSLLDAEQNAYKITANSLYGQLGSATFKIRLQHLAASVTAYGRKQIMFSKEAIVQFYGPHSGDPRCAAEIVYGDTDSIFINFNPKGPDGKKLEGREAVIATMELTEEAGKFITGALKAPHDFEYDKTFYPFIIFSKKRYVGNKYEESPDDYKETSMGIVTKRRDNAPLLKMLYQAALQQLLKHKDVFAATRAVKDGVKELVEGKMKLSQLTITKSLKSDYKGTPPAHKILADRIKIRDPGNAPVSGERLGYVYVKAEVGQQASKLQGERIETPGYIVKNSLQPDYEYYILHQLMNPLSQLFGIFVEKMPGFVAPVKWETGDKLLQQKEIIAGELLFREGLQSCNKLAKQAFFGKLGGPTTVTKTFVEKKIVKPLVQQALIAAPVKKQSSIASYLADSMLLDSMKKTREKKKERVPP